MKKPWKTLCLLLALALALPLAGCGGKARSYDPDNFIADTSNQQIVKEKVTLRMFVPRHSLHGDYAKMRLFTEMERITNIHVEFVEANVDSYNELKSTSWDDPNPVDAYLFWNTPEEQVFSAGQGLIQPIGELIDSYAPNYKKVMEAYPDIEKVTTLDDGKIYTFAAVSDVPRDLTFKQFINKDWLDNVGKEMPTTTDELYDVLKAFKDGDANGNGFTGDEVPLSSRNLYQTRNFLMSAFGFVSTGVEVDYDTGTVHYVPATDNYYAYLSYANRLYQDGLLDKDVFTLSQDKDLARKGSQGILGSFDHAAAYLIVGNNLDDQYTAIPPLTSEISNKKMWLGFDAVTPQQLMIRSDTPYQREIVRWFDFLYSDEGKILQAFGKEGVDWHWDDEEKTTWTFDVPEGQDIEAYRGTLTPSVGLGSVAYWSKDFVLKDSTRQIRNINKAVEEAGYMDYLKTPYPQVRFTDDEQRELSLLRVDLNNLVDQYEAKLILDKNFSRAKFDDFVGRLTSARYRRYLEIHQNAYDHYVGK